MSDESENSASEAPPPAAPASSPPGEPLDEPESAPDPLEAARAELVKVRESLLRTAADFDNFRKRTRKEIQDAEHRSREELLRELLPLFDNLERAEQHAQKATDVHAVAEGVRMVLKMFHDTLGRIDVQRVESIGLPFDPSVQEAIQQVESADVPPGAVIAEVQAGYRWGARLVRPAMVVVAKAPAATSAPDAVDDGGS